MADTNYANIDFLILTKDSTVERWVDELHHAGATFNKQLNFKLLRNNTSKAQACHDALVESDHPYFALVDLPITKIEPDWVTLLLAGFRSEKIGVSCGRVYIDGTDGQSFITPDTENKTPLYHNQFLTAHTMQVNGIHCPQELPCCAWKLALMKRDIYDSAGGFDYDTFPSLYAMADLSCRIRSRGYHIIYSPFVSIDTPGNVNGNGEDLPESHGHEKKSFQKKWLTPDSGDYFNRSILEDNGYDPESFATWFYG